MNGVLILAFLWILKAFLEVITMKSTELYNCKELLLAVVKRIELGTMSVLFDYHSMF